MAKIIDLTVADVVKGTSTNSSGMVLFLEMDRVISEGNNIRLILEEIPLFTSSFLNSSFGELYDKYGESDLKGRIILSRATAAHINNIKGYLDRLTDLQDC